MTSRHIVLAGDSIFDNDIYVLGEPGVIEQLRTSIPDDWSAYKIAVDGDCIRDIRAQLKGLPSHATDLIVSVGGNDVLHYADLLQKVTQLSDLPGLLTAPLAAFRAEYGQMLQLAKGTGLKTSVCTIYTAVPFEEILFRQYAPIAIAEFNRVILEEAGKLGLPVIRLEEVCTREEDYSKVSPIEPSAIGGQKIVDHLIETLRLTL